MVVITHTAIASTNNTQPSGNRVGDLPSHNSVTSPPEPPLVGLNNRAPRKRRKKIQTREEDGSRPLPAPQSHDELMKLTIGQLISHAQEGSKGAMSDDDREFFAKFYEEQRMKLAIQAIERGVSVSMVDTFLGSRVAFQDLNEWNLFLKTPEA
ncbi:hypothetical protein PtB15_12B214 [Puccinia triticina]|nr:hypothetical protein PtB15_12B214 [Puccinia triticina]